MDEKAERRHCINCKRELVRHKGVYVCINCNPGAIDTSAMFVDDLESDNHMFIECPGATLYEADTGEVIEGVRFHDDDDPASGYDIVGQQIFAPNHKKRRRIRRDAFGRIRRCRACQDYTIRMRRPEGRDFFIPSTKHPRRDKLRPMEHVTYEPHG